MLKDLGGSMVNKKSIRNIDVQNKKVLVRVDYNVPMDDNGKITDDTRITASIPTISYLIEHGASIILMAHFGRPKGAVNEKYSLAPVAKYLAELIKKEVLFVADCVGEEAKKIASTLKPGQILMLENLRFHAAEEKNDLEFAHKLASLADVYVNDGFGVSHRAHASVDGVTYYLQSVAGLLLEKEINFLGKAVTNPKRPFVAIIGGAKVSDKIGVIENLLSKVDLLLIGGGMANTFLKAQGFAMGTSLVEEEKIELAKSLIVTAKERGVKMLLPVDLVVADKFANDAVYKNCKLDEIPDGWMALDIGKETQILYANALKNVATVVWNGPMGVFEMESFCGGTEAVAKAVAATDAISIVGGGDSVAAIERLGLASEITHISTGGGASLEFLEGKLLPGIDALEELRIPMIAGNWKMHKTVSESVSLAKEIAEVTTGAKAEVVIFPTFTSLESVAEAVDGKEISYGAQDLHWEAQGAFTGAISGEMIKDIGCEYVLVGHSERRHIFDESDTIIAKKLQAAYRSRLIPVLCVGELLSEREAGQTEKVIARQLETALKAEDKKLIAKMVIAYEPVWAIGTGKTASIEDASKVCTFIRNYINDKFGEQVAATIRILYGGSVNDSNIAGFMKEEDIDGALVGGASLTVDSFQKIVRY